MRRVHDLICKCCSDVERDVIIETDAYPRCPKCDGERGWLPAKLVTDEWGGPRHIRSLDMTFSSKSELRSYMRAHRLQECGDKEGGARNESHLNLGKKFSYAGQDRR